MLRTLGTNETINTCQFGNYFPYWAMIDGKVVIGDTAEEIFKAYPSKLRVVDPAAVFSLMQFNYMMGNRTLIQGINRVPWRAELTGTGKITRRPPVQHGFRYEKPAITAAALLEGLEEEIYEKIKGRKRIFLMLSGGLDSRIMAGVVKRLEPKCSAKVVCLTWGMPRSRDVVYGKRIADWYGWDFQNIDYDAEKVWQNIERGAKWGGAEVAGLHLHGMDHLRIADKGDQVLAASFGDMIGRAEFSSTHLTKLRKTALFNRFDLIHASLEKEAMATIEQDRTTAWESESPFVPEFVRHELHQAENYMRRFNCHTMDYIRQFCDLHQIFTTDRIISLMWSLSPEGRTDDVYYELLKMMDKRLFSLPWARTGMGLDGTKETDMSLAKEFHEWGKWLRNDLRDRLEAQVFSPELENLGVFDPTALKRTWKKFLSEPETELCTGQQIVNIAAVAIAQKHFSLLPCRKATPSADVALALPRTGARLVRKVKKKALRILKNPR